MAAMRISETNLIMATIGMSETNGILATTGISETVETLGTRMVWLEALGTRADLGTRNGMIVMDL
jgi:hypothetical protein